MYGYVFDSFVQDGKFRTESQRIETRLTTLGIQGRQEKITILKNLVDASQMMMKRGVETLVVVGNDETVLKVLPVILAHKVPLGFIPVGPHQRLAEALGIPVGVSACDVLSRRVMRRVDVGRAGDVFFLLDALLPAQASVYCDGRYTVTTTSPSAQMRVTNIADPRPGGAPDDGLLTLVVEGEKTGGWWSKATDQSIFPIEKAEIRSSRSSDMVTLDGRQVIKTPVTISLEKKLLQVIVGRARGFV